MTDRNVLNHIEELIAEEQRLYHQSHLSIEERSELDALQVQLDETGRGDLSASDRLLELGNRRVFQMKRAPSLLRGSGGSNGDDDEAQCEREHFDHGAASGRWAQSG